MPDLTLADALRLAINALRHSAESRKMPSGVGGDDAEAELHATCGTNAWSTGHRSLTCFRATSSTWPLRRRNTAWTMGHRCSKRASRPEERAISAPNGTTATTPAGSCTPNGSRDIGEAVTKRLVGAVAQGQGRGPLTRAILVVMLERMTRWPPNPCDVGFRQPLRPLPDSGLAPAVAASSARLFRGFSARHV